MQTSTRLATLAIAIICSTNLAQAQQAVRKPAPKTVSQAKKPAAKSATGSVRKPAATPVSTRMQAPTPAASAAPATSADARQAPVAQAEPRPQPGARPASVRTHTTRSTSSRGRHVYLNAGLGIATYYGGGLPLGISVEVESKNNFSLGGSIDYYHYSYGYNFTYIGGRASYHLGDALNVQNNSFDPYVGATLGFRHTGYGSGYYDGYSGYNSGLYIGVHVGARFMFAPKVGAFAEVGYGVSALKLGLTAKF